ncbi:MAG: hypothetical protein JRH10_02875 [Deltaproteobacteria bacterium]|nr:hypothetical protein [Deltaproteobacteria bacterium]
MTRPPEFWDGTVRRLAEAVPAHEIEAWLRPLHATRDGAEIRIVCPSALHRDRVRARYLDAIRAALGAELDSDAEAEARASRTASRCRRLRGVASPHTPQGRTAFRPNVVSSPRRAHPGACAAPSNRVSTRSKWAPPTLWPAKPRTPWPRRPSPR